MRIVSVLPSATEIVFALGAGDSLVGRSAECDYPVSARSLPVVMAPRTLDGDRSAGEIDARVQAALKGGSGLYELDLQQLAALQPDVILTQDLCRVCSITDEEVRTACAQAGVGPRIVSVSPTRLSEVWDSIAIIGSAIGRQEQANLLALRLRRQCQPANRPEPGARVALIEWPDPPIEAGLWAPDMLRAAGGEPLQARPGRPGSRTSWSEICVEKPGLVVLSPCSFGVERTMRELARERLASSAAEVAPPLGFWVADEAYFSRPGPRLAQGVELLRRLLAGRPPGSDYSAVQWSKAPSEVAA